MAEPIRSTHFSNLNDTGQNISAGKVALSCVLVTNDSAAATFVQVFFMAAAEVTLGTTKPVFTIACADKTTAGVSWGRPILVDGRMSAFATTTVEGNTGSGNGVCLQVFME